MLSVVSEIAGASFMEILVPILGHAFWFAPPKTIGRIFFGGIFLNGYRGMIKGYLQDITKGIQHYILPNISWVG